MNDPKSNDLYIAVLPLIHLGHPSYGLTEQVITLLPDRNLATSFFPDEVESYILMLKNRTKYLVGGHVTGYTFETEQAEQGRVVVRVIQDVQ
jgi:hypothetical protein